VTRPLEGALVHGLAVRVGPVETRITRVAGTAAKPIVRVDAASTREELESLRGEPLWVPRDAAPPLEEDEYWAEDLVGLRVIDGERAVGEVERVMALPSCEVLVVGELLIPLVGDAVRAVDVQAGVVDVDLEFLGEG
jgi:16S rRNA processing protein RimM